MWLVAPPVHSSNIALTRTVQTIQVRMVAIEIPPGTFVNHGTVSTAELVIITILGGK